MATSSAMNTSNQYVKYKISITQNSRDINNNKSSVTVSVNFYRTNTGYTTYGSGTVYCKINGTQYSAAVGPSQKITENGIVLFSKTLDIPHNADGKKTLTCSAWISLNTPLTSSEQSYSQELTAIPRQANLTAAPNFSDEQNPTITYSNPAGNSVASLRVCIANSAMNGTYANWRDVSKTGTSYTFNLTEAERNAIRNATPNSTNLSVNFMIETTIGSNIYYSNITKTATIVNSTPVIEPTVTVTDTLTKTLTGNSDTVIKGISSANYVIGARALKGATINGQWVQNGSIQKNETSGSFTNLESGYFLFAASDTRNLHARAAINKGFIDYIKLTCNISDNIPDTSGKMTVKCSGNYFNGSFGAVANTLTVQYRYKTQGGNYSGWVDMTVSKSGNTYTATATLTGLDYKLAYVFQTRAIDKINTSGINSAEKTVRSTPVFDWGENDFKFNVDVFDKYDKEIFSPLLGGIGGQCKVVSGDWNTACGNQTGFYMGNNLANRPTDMNTVDGWFYVIHLVHNETFKTQIFLSFGQNQIAIRSMNAGNWSGFTRII